ncbi:MAG: DUF4038 domain-containing protein, partial [Bacteroidota bacterium]
LPANPHDVSVHVLFEGSDPSGGPTPIAGFWDGDSTYRVRFAPPDAGRYRYTVESSDPALDGQTGTVEADTPTGKPWLEVQGRHLVRGDEPAFLLADTAWELPRKANPAEVLRYLDDRAEKNFEAVFVVPMSHYAITADGSRNDAGIPFFIGEDFNRPNPRYFDFLDFVITEANRRGLTVGIVPVWAGTTQLHPVTWGENRQMTTAQADRIIDYVAARYAGHDVLWLMGGDNSFSTPEQRQFWDAAARRVQARSGGRHLMTLHPHGYAASYDFFPTADWVDFHMYQSSHVAGGEYAGDAAANAFDHFADRPAMNGEGNYEDLFNEFWRFGGDTTHVDAFRITAEHVRQAAYESVLNGALVGFGYGANGVWQWSTADIPGPFWPRRYAVGALDFPGSSSLQVMRGLMEDVGWTRLVPRNDLVDSRDPGRLATAAHSDVIVAYVPGSVHTLTLQARGLHLPASYRWIDAASGMVVDSRWIVGSPSNVELRKPGFGDFVLVVEAGPPDPPEITSTQPFAHAVYPNPARTPALALALPRPEPVWVDVHDVLGRHQYRRYVPAGQNGVRVALPGLRPGRYVYTARIGGIPDLPAEVLRGVFVVTR